MLPGKSMAGLEVAKHVWKKWGLQGMVLLSLTVQVVLLFLAELRRHIHSVVLTAFVWSVYMLADATAIYVLGHLSVTSRLPEHELLALWAPFLLVHLGGQDNITAYALVDNQLWLRHLQTFVVQVVTAAYIIYGSSIILGKSSSLLLLVTILLFFVGVIKYGKRVWALRCAGSSPTGNYWGRGDGYISGSLCLGLPESLKGTGRLRDPEAFLLEAHLLLDFAKDLFKGPLPGIALYTGTNTPAGPAGPLHGGDGEEVYKMAEMQVSLLYDLFYTKAEVTHTWYGLCLRILLSLAISVAFLLFNMLLLGSHHRGQLKGGYSRVDVVATYVLFVGAVVLEATSLFRAMFSSWTCALLLKCTSSRHKRITASVCTFLAHVILYLRHLVRAADWRRRCSWSRSMGQHNLAHLWWCKRKRNWASRSSSRIARWIGLDNYWNVQAYSWSIPVSACVEQLLLKRIKAMQEAAVPQEQQQEEEEIAQNPYLRVVAAPADQEEEQQESPTYSWSSQRAVPVARQWGREALINRGLDENIASSIKMNKLDESILIWHMATDVYLCWYRDQKQAKLPSALDAGAGAGGDPDGCWPADLFVDGAQALSNYMLFVLAALPHMLPPVVGGDAYSKLEECLSGFQDYSSAEELRRLLPRHKDLPIITYNETFRRGCELGAFLVGRRDTASVCDTLEMICQVWTEMLCYVGHGCGKSCHARQLSSGGEFITIAALVAKYMTSPNLRGLVSAPIAMGNNLQNLQSV